jgi:hypothetical protein
MFEPNMLIMSARPHPFSPKVDLPKFLAIRTSQLGFTCRGKEKAEMNFILFLALAMQAGIAEEDSRPGQAILPASEYLLTKKEIDGLRPLALSGDVEKALAISNHYFLFMDDEIDAEFWLRVAAEHNDCHALKEYVWRIAHTPRLNSEARLTSWKEREAKACISRQSNRCRLSLR